MSFDKKQPMGQFFVSNGYLHVTTDWGMPGYRPGVSYWIKPIAQNQLEQP